VCFWVCGCTWGGFDFSTIMVSPRKCYYFCFCSQWRRRGGGGSCMLHVCREGMQWCSWLRHCAASWKVTFDSPWSYGTFFYWLNPYGHIVALGSTHLNRNEYQLCLLRLKAASMLGWQLCHLHVLSIEVLEASTSQSPKGLSRPLMVLLYLNLCVVLFQIFEYCVVLKYNKRWQQQLEK